MLYIYRILLHLWLNGWVLVSRTVKATVPVGNVNLPVCLENAQLSMRHSLNNTKNLAYGQRVQYVTYSVVVLTRLAPLSFGVDRSMVGLRVHTVQHVVQYD